MIIAWRRISAEGAEEKREQIKAFPLNIQTFEQAAKCLGIAIDYLGSVDSEEEEAYLEGDKIVLTKADDKQ